jgi:rod shape-determining protein MreD
MFTLIIFVSAIVLQTSVLDILTIKGIKPDLVLLIVVYLGLIRGSDIGCLSGFFFGLVEDVYSGMYLGSNALTKTIVGFFCGISGKRLYTHSLLSQILCVGIGTVIDVVLLLSINGFGSIGSNWRQLLLYETLYNILCCPFVVLIFRFGEKRLGVKSSSPRF